LDVSKYIDKHPGGGDVIVEVAGEDCNVANNMFEDIGHTPEAQAIMKTFIIGDLIVDPNKVESVSSRKSDSKGGGSPIFILILVLAIVLGYYQMQQSK
jgi:cytochrome b involved in lipid metabolism